MIDSALAYFLAILVAFTLASWVAIISKLLIMIFILFILGAELATRHLPQINQPVDFSVGIFHGFLAVWMGRGVFGYMEVKVDIFLAFFLLIAFLWFDFNRIRSQKHFFLQSQQHPDLERESPLSQQQLQESMQSSSVIMLIGKIAGVLLGGMNLLDWAIIH